MTEIRYITNDIVNEAAALAAAGKNHLSLSVSGPKSGIGTLILDIDSFRRPQIVELILHSYEVDLCEFLSGRHTTCRSVGEAVHAAAISNAAQPLKLQLPTISDHLTPTS